MWCDSDAIVILLIELVFDLLRNSCRAELMLVRDRVESVEERLRLY